MTEERLRELLQRFKDLRIVLIGDLFLDRWYVIDPKKDEPSLETGKMAHQVVRKYSAPGAGGTVLNNLAAMGAGKIEVISLIGKDGDGWELMDLLARRGIDTSGVIRTDLRVTPAYIKPLSPEEGERMDIKNFTPTPRSVEDALIRQIEDRAGNADAVILLDQVCEENCGVLTDRVREAAMQMAQKNPEQFFLADSRAFIDRFRQVSVKCNNLEARAVTRSGDERESFSLEAVSDDLIKLEQITGRPAFITCNKYGIAVRANGAVQLIPAVQQKGPIDVCGAGDAATAAIACAIGAGAGREEAAKIACLASGVTVRKLNETGTASQKEMLELL